MSDIALDQVVALALKLSATEQAKLLERVAANLSQTIEQPQSAIPADSTATWGAQMVELLDQLDFSEWEAMDISDPVEWLKAQRQQAWKHTQARWDAEE
jgi:hypothetical protein